jgi:hypothetical protein
MTESRTVSNASRHAQLGWVRRDPNASDIVAMREHLREQNGIRGLEILDPGDVERAVRVFDRDGFVVVADALTSEQLATLRAGVLEVVDDIVELDEDRGGNR